MYNNRGPQDTRFAVTGKDGVIYDGNGKMLVAHRRGHRHGGVGGGLAHNRDSPYPGQDTRYRST